MKNRKQNKAFALLITVAMILSMMATVPATVSASGVANTYYVDSAGGNDGSSGTSEGEAWKTLDKVNSTTFQPGDKILFKAGCSWDGQLWPKGSGENGSPIVIDMYGEGEKPLINGGPMEGPGEEPEPEPEPTPEPENPMPNRMANPGLESGDATGWQFKGDVVVVNNNQHTGSYAVKINSGSDSAAEQVVTGLKPNTTYRLKVWTKVENEPGKEGAQICLGMKEYGNPEAGVRTSSTVYTPLSIEFTTGPTNTSVRTFLWYSGSSGWAYGDDFEVKEVVTVVDLTNPGFESNDKTGWVASDAWNIVNNNQYAGDYCAQIPLNSSAEMNVTGLMPNTYYRFSAWVKVGTASEAAYLGVKDYGGQETSKKTSSTTYTQLKVDFLTGPEQTTATIYMKRDNSGSGFAYGDDFDVRLLPQSLIPKDDPNNKVSNAGFETGVMSPWGVSNEWSVVNDNQKKGEFSAQIKPGGAAQQTITGLKKNKGYKLRAFVKVEDASTVAQLGVKEYGGSEVSSVTSSTDYQFISVDFTTGADSTTATIYLKNSAGTRLVYGDDFELSERGSETFKLRNQSYWEVNNLQITNFGSEGIEAKRRAVYVEAADQGTISHIYLKNLDIHDVNGGDPNHRNLDYESGGIIMLVNDDFQAPDVKSKFDDVLIEGCTFRNVSKEGIFIRNNYRLRGGFTAENTPDALGEWYPNTNVVIRNNSLDTIGGDGIVAAECQAPLIEYNVAKDCHNDHEFWCVAIWSINCDDAVIQNNEAYGTKTTDDGQGFDIDWNQNRTIMQYNYSHDNEGGFMLMCCWYGDSFNNDSIVRYNISQNDLCRIFEIHGPVKNSQIYNNTIYVRAGIAPKIYNLDWWDSTDGRYPEDTYNYNNIIYNLGNGGYNFTNSVNTVFDNNCFYGKHPNSEPADAHKITGDPMLVNPGTGGVGRDTVGGYQLQSCSPLINAGKTIPDNGGKDFWGNPVPYHGGKTDIGAFEYQGVKQPNPNNKVQNPGFESGEADPWNVGINEVAYDNQYDGNYCIKVAKNSSAEQTVTGLTPNTTYTLKAWVKVDDESDTAYLGVKSYGGEDKAATTSSTEYAQLSVEFTTGAADETATVYLWRSDTGAGSAYGDDFEIMPSSLAPPPQRVNVLKPNQGFEDGNKTGWSTDGTNEVVGTNQHSGNYCIEITPGNSIERLVTGLRPNTDYTLSAWAKVEGGSGVVYLGAKNYGYDEIAAKTSSSSYVRLSVDFTTGPTDTSVKIYLWRDGTGEGSAFGDDFEILGTLSAPTPLDTVPTPNQTAWQELELTAFAHFGMNTFTGAEWGTGTEDPGLFNPTDFNAAQWISTLQDAGFKMLILTAKHHDGFCLWPSAYTTHDVASSPWRNGEGDVVKEVADACHAAGMKFGIYLSPWDRHEPSYGPGGDDYNVYYMNQLRELLTNYGEISEVWMDGANDNTKPQDYNIYQWADLVYELQPTAVIFQGNFDIRWAGNERGVADEPCWATVDENRTPVPGGTRWMPAECDVPIRPGWFYHESEDTQVKSLNELAYIYKNSVGLGANLLLSVSPDKRGLIPDADVNRLNEFKNYMAVTYGNNLAQGAVATASVTRDVYYDASCVLDNDKTTYWSAPDGENTASITLDLGSMKEFDMVELQEPIELGQRITGYNLEAWNGNSWISLAAKQAVGNKAIVQFEPVMASKVRLNITNALACPAIRTMKVYLEAEVRCNAVGGTVTASTENPPNERKEYAFDDSSATKWLTLDNKGWIQYDFKDEKSYAINRYTITSANDVPARDPKDWTLKGSNDGVTWETLDTREGINFDNRFQTLTFNIDNTNFYKIYRIDITANHGDNNMQLAEIELYGVALPQGDLCIGGEVSTSNENVNPEWNQYHYAIHAFDDILGDSKWMTLEKPAWIQYDFAGEASYAVKSYTITSANENEPGRDPKDWTLEGSNDGNTWVVVDAQTNQMFEGRLLKKTYNTENTIPYKMYKLNISDNNDPDVAYIQLAEIEMFAVHQLPPDTEAPAAPTGLAVINNTGSSVTIIWEASTDNVAVAGYDVYRNGTKIGATTATSYTDSAVEGETSYIYTVRAFDAAQNTSEASAELHITTPVVLVDICEGGLATASSQNTLWGNNHIAEHAFDNGNNWSQWMTLALSTPIHAWIQYDFADESAYAVNGYSITSCADAPQRDPKSWTFEGSNDGATWFPLHEVEDEIFESRLLKKTYHFNNTTAYKMYRLNITDSIGPEDPGGSEYYVQILEIEMFGTLGTVQPSSKTKVALVGDSITDMGVYPSELQKMLGTDYIIRNYGQSGCTLLKSGDYPYWNQQDYTDSANWLPDAVVIMLGTNDSKGYNWNNGNHAAEFLSNFKEMINHYKNLASHPTVYVNTCPTVYLADSGDINENIISNEIIPLILQAADEAGAIVIDVHSATAGMEENFPDKVHPNSAGSRVIASTVYAGIKGAAAPILPEDLCLGGTSTASGETANQGADKLFDDNIFFSKWMVIGSTGWVQYDFEGESAYAVNGYSIISADDEPVRDPKNWTFEGSNNGTDWIIVDSRTNESFSSRSQMKTYTFANTTQYQMYRLNISANQGGSELQIAEIEMFGSIGTLPDQVPGDFSLTNPADKAVAQSLTPILTWGAAQDSVSYHLVVSVHEDMSSPIVSTTIESNSYQLPGLAYETTYYWKVTAINGTAIKEAVNNGISFKTLAYSRPEDTYTPPVTTAPGPDISNGTVKITPKLDGNSNKAKSDLTLSDYTKALETAQSGKDGVKTVVLEVKKVDNAAGYVQKLPTAAVTALDNKRRITIKTELSEITIPGDMLSNLKNISTSSVEISVTKVDTHGFSEELKSKIGDRPVIDVNLLIDEKAVAWSNVNTFVEIALPYVPSAEELKNPDHIVVWYISDHNEVIPITNGRYDAERGAVVFTTNHFSTYAISYVIKSFDDIDSYQWAKKEIEAMASKGVISGTSATNFNPERDITRADFMILLVKVLGLTAEFDANFDDVDQNKYYYNAIGIAKELGIVSGAGNNKFLPAEKLTRQDMMVLIVKALEKVGIGLPEGSTEDLDKFKDADRISTYAKESVSMLVKGGLVAGDGSNIHPGKPSSRAEVAVLIYKIYKLVQR